MLRPCVAALEQQSCPHELVIVDNGSHDGTVEWVRHNVASAQLVTLPSNQGFAGGNNRGIEAAEGDLIVLINNDTLPAPDALAQLIAPFAASDRLGATAGVLTFAHRPEVVASAGIQVGRDLVHHDLWATEPVTKLPSDPVPIFGPSGGAVCYRRAALEDVGLFDPHFFAYLEDADLAWRLRLREWETVLAPAARIRHVYSATGGQGSPFKQRLLGRNRWWTILRSVPGAILAGCLPSIARYETLTVAYALLKRQPAPITGRFQVLRALPRVLSERQRIQAGRTAAIPALARWLQPARGVRETLAQVRALDAVLAQR